ncbi:MAG: hypothetical protein K6347_08315 [Campylobacterales bacterium]
MKRKSGFVLLATLALILFIGLLVSFSMTIVQRTVASVQQSVSLPQTMVVIRDTKAILTKTFDKINTPEEFDFLLGYPVELKDEASGTSLTVDIKPLWTGLNPNLLADANNSQLFREAWVRLLSDYKVVDSELFLALIEDTLDHDLNPRREMSEIALDDPLFTNGSIGSMTQFREIVHRYAAAANDPRIYHLPWREILSFEAQKIDINYASPRLLHLFFSNTF